MKEINLTIEHSVSTRQKSLMRLTQASHLQIERWLAEVNLKDKRIQQRLKLVIGFVERKFGRPGNECEVSRDELRSEFAFGQGKKLRELAKILLMEVRAHIPGIVSNSYCVNAIEFRRLIEIVETTREACVEYRYARKVEHLAMAHAEELRTGDFKYSKAENERLSREYHPLVYCEKEVRMRVLADAGYRFQFDLKSAFPTLVSQWWASVSRIQLHYLNRLVSSPDEFRNELSEHLDVPLDVVKQILTSMLFGSKLSKIPRTSFSCFRALGCDADKWNLLIAHPFIQGYRKDVVLLRRLCRTAGLWTQSGPILVSDKNEDSLYILCEWLEKKVREAMTAYCQQRGMRVLKIHDCVAVDADLSVEELVMEVKLKTGFIVKLSKEAL